MKIAILAQGEYFHYATRFINELLNEIEDDWYITTDHLTNFDWMKYDLVVSLLYHRKIHNTMLDLPKLGIINIHPSFLPYHRGSNPHFWAVLSGVGAGWTAHRMTAEINRGDIYLQRAVPVLLSDTAETLWDRMLYELPDFLSELAKLVSTGKLEPIEIEQNKDRVNTLKEFHEAHNFQELIKEMDPLQQIASYATLTMIQACSFGDYEGFVMDTPDGRVEFKARRIE